MGLINDVTESETIAKSVEDTNDVFFVPAFDGFLISFFSLFYDLSRSLPIRLYNFAFIVCLSPFFFVQLFNSLFVLVCLKLSNECAQVS